MRRQILSAAWLRVLSLGWLFIRIGSFIPVFDALCAHRLKFSQGFFANAALREMTSCCWIFLAGLGICGRICTHWSRCRNLIFPRLNGRSFWPTINFFCHWFRCLTQFHQKERLAIDWLRSWVRTQAFWLYRFSSFGRWNCRYQFTRIPLLVNWGRTSFRQLRTRSILQESIESGSFSCCSCIHCAGLPVSFILSRLLLKHFTELCWETLKTTFSWGFECHNWWSRMSFHHQGIFP